MWVVSGKAQHRSCSVTNSKKRTLKDKPNNLTGTRTRYKTAPSVREKSCLHYHGVVLRERTNSIKIVARHNIALRVTLGKQT